MLSPWIAGKKTFKSHPAAFDGAIFLYRLQAIRATGRCKTAINTEKRGNCTLVEADNAYEQYGE